MSVIYFTNNAGSGDGSLVEAIKDASPGDVIRPDENVFERGSTIEIFIASTLKIDKTLTLDGGPYRVRLYADGAFRCATASGGDGVKFAEFDFLYGAPSAGDGGCVSASVPLTLERCGVFGGVGGYGGGVFARSTLTLNDYVVTGCRAKTAGGGVTSLNGLTLRGTTIVGNVSANANSDAVRHEGGDLSATNSIVGPVRATGGGALSYHGSVVGVAPSQIGFVASPPDDLSAETWDAYSWRNWDLHLLDDASPNPSPYRDAGAVEHMSRYDFEGNFRGRTTEGVAACSPGAYETIQADLFWIFYDANGNYTNSLRINNPAGWATSRFAYNGSNICPQDVESVFVQYNAYSSSHFQINADLGVHPKFVIGGGGFVKFGSACIIASREIVLGANAVLDAGGYVTPSLILGDKSSVYGRNEYFLTGETVYNACDEAYVEYCEVTGRASGNIKSRQLRVKRKRNATVQLAGEYYCGFFQVLSPADSNADGYGDEFMIATEPGTTIHAVDVEINRHYSGEKVFTNPVDFKLFGERSYITGEYVEEGLTDNWNDDISFDVSGADLVLFDCDFYGGPILYGNNTNPNQYYNGVEFNRGNLKIDKRGLVTPKLSINTYRAIDNGASLKIVDAELSVADASILNVQILINSDGVDVLRASKCYIYGRFQLSGGTMEFGTLVVDVDGELFITEASVEADYLAVIYPKVAEINNSTLDVTDFGAGNATCTVNTSTVATQTVYIEGFFSVEFIGEDSVFRALTITSSDDVRCNGIGYLVVPENSRNFSMEQISPGVRVCDYGAGVKTFAAAASGKTVALEWNAENVNTPVLIECRSGDGWLVAANGVAGGSATVAVDTSGDIMFRIFDGEKFLLTSAYVDRFHAWLVYDNLFTSAVVVKSYKIVTEVVLMSVYFNANEAPVFLARIVDSATNVPVVPSDVESIALTVYKQELYRGSKRKTKLSGWVNVVVPTSAIKGELVVDDPRWKKDSVGYNFLYEPDLREKKLFAEAGEYVAIITVTFKEGNPAPLVFNVSVK